ncbi:MAG: MarR family winged helix-turn-helix transcriptional regulator [Actinomadura sp.]
MVSADSVYDELLTQLSAAGAVIKSLKRALPRDCPAAGLAVLVTLQRSGELRPGALAELFDVDQSVISRHIAELEQRGLAARTPNPRDGRSWYLRLTPAGEQATEDAMVRLREIAAETLEDWTDEEIAELSGLLGRLRTSFDARSERGRRAAQNDGALAPQRPPARLRE